MMSDKNFNFYLACEQGNIELVKRSMNFLENIDQKNELGRSGLILAAFNGHKDVVELLLDNGANVNDINKNGTTIFMYAKDSVLRTKDFSILDLLLQRGANINARDKKNLSVLDYVKNNKYDILLEYMISHGAM